MRVFPFLLMSILVTDHKDAWNKSSGLKSKISSAQILLPPIYINNQPMRRILPLFLLLSLIACQRDSEPLLAHFPPSSVFKNGFANKYYNHFSPYDKDSRGATRISYATYQLLDGGVIEIKNYNAGYELRGWQYYHYADNGFYLDSSWYIAAKDTIQARIEAGILKNFTDSTTSFYRENYEYDDQEHQYLSHQYDLKDTLIDKKPGKHFYFNRSYHNLDKDSTAQSWEAREIYVQDIGFYYSWEESTYGTYETELVEQMSISEFEKRANHGEHRVAWIDPENNLGGDPDFKICGSEKDIADYYNGDPDAEFARGKKMMINRIKAQLNPKYLKGINGMLTFRFVISCEGRAGRFIAQAYDFNYQKIEVPESSVQHVYEILQTLKDWQPTVIRDEARDSYAYITLKIEDGKIIDFLP